MSRFYEVEEWHPGLTPGERGYWEKISIYNSFNNDYCWPGWYPENGRFSRKSDARRYLKARAGTISGATETLRIVKVTATETREVD